MKGKIKVAGVVAMCLVLVGLTVYAALALLFDEDKIDVEITSRTEYIEGDQGQILTEVRFALTDLAVSANCWASAIYPNKTAFFTDVPMSSTGIGTYNYTFIVPGVEGVYEYQSTCEVTPGRNITRSKAFHVSGLFGELQKTINERIEVISQGVSQAGLRKTVANTWQLDTVADLSIGVPVCTVGLVDSLNSTITQIQGELLNTPATVEAVEREYECERLCLSECLVDVPVPVDVQRPLSNMVYNFEEGSGSSSTSYDAVLGGQSSALFSGGYSWINEGPGNLSWSVRTDGVTGKIELPQSPAFRFANTQWFWVRTNSTSGGTIWGGFYNSGSKHAYLKLNPNGTITALINRTVDTAGFINTSTITINDGNWHFIQWDYQGSSELYIDGTLALTGSSGWGATGTVTCVGLGAFCSQGPIWSEYLEADFAQYGSTYTSGTTSCGANQCRILTQEESNRISQGEVVQDYNFTCGDGWKVNETYLSDEEDVYPRNMNASFDDSFFMIDYPGGVARTGTNAIVREIPEFDSDFVLQFYMGCFTGGATGTNCRSGSFYIGSGGAYESIDFLDASGDMIGSLNQAGPGVVWDAPGSPYSLRWTYANGSYVNITTDVGTEGYNNFNVNGTWQIVREEGQIKILLNGADNAPTAQRLETTNPNVFYNNLDPSIVIYDDDFDGTPIAAIRIRSNNGAKVEVPFDGEPAQDQQYGFYYDDIVLSIFGIEDKYVLSGGSGTGGPGSNDDKLTYYWFSDASIYDYNENYEVECTIPYSFDSGKTGELLQMSQFVYITNEGRIRAVMVK